MSAAPRRARRPAGFSLIELLVSMAIGLILTLAITVVMTQAEGNKRSTTSVNDIDQTGNYLAYMLDRAIRSAGSGFSQSWSTAYGCRLNVSRGTTQVLPLPSALPTGSAFSGIVGGAGGLPLRLAPVIIAKGAAAGTGGDALIVMAGAAGVGEVGVPVSAAPIPTGATSLPMPNALGFGTNDLVLLADSAAPVNGNCLMEQVGTRTRTSSSTVLPLAGTYFTSAGANVALTAFGASTTAIQLGNAGTGTLNMPQFQILAVGSNNTLFTYDLLTPVAGSTPPDVPLADGVVQMRAIYGLDTSAPPDGKIDAWTDATAGSGGTSDFSAATLTDGSAASRTKLRQIVAIRLGLILRTSLAERPKDYAQPPGTVLTLFSDAIDTSGASLKQTRTLAANELNYRFRTVELTIPVRNTLLAP